MTATRPLDFAPGTAERYSNSGYVLLAAAIERGGGAAATIAALFAAG
jgi:CubicO group peptidase (beta-lactamase class C family)